MTYVKNGGYIRLIDQKRLAHFAEMGFVPMRQAATETAKPARASKKEKPYGGV